MISAIVTTYGGIKHAGDSVKETAGKRFSLSVIKIPNNRSEWGVARLLYSGFPVEL